MLRRVCRLLAFTSLLIVLSCNQLLAQGVAAPGGMCKPVSQRTQEVGCWILADDPIGQLVKSPVFWYLDVYSTRAAAEADKKPRGAILESLGKVWLMTIEDDRWNPAHGNRIAKIGPLPIVPGDPSIKRAVLCAHRLCADVQGRKALLYAVPVLRSAATR
jgi:hypothetical protein